MCRATGVAKLRPVGEIEFANGVAAMAASGTYGKTQACAGIVVVEIPQGGVPVKYELDKASGAVFVDRFLHTAMF